MSQPTERDLVQIARIRSAIANFQPSDFVETNALELTISYLEAGHLDKAEAEFKAILERREGTV